MSDTITGHCLCGATSYTAEGPAKFAIVCYCTDCQRVTGSGHAPQLGVASDGLQIDGPLRTHDAKASTGSDLSFQFCGDCGSPIAKSTTRAPSTVFLYAGSLDNPDNFPDATPVFEDSRQPWDS